MAQQVVVMAVAAVQACLARGLRVEIMSAILQLPHRLMALDQAVAAAEDQDPVGLMLLPEAMELKVLFCWNGIIKITMNYILDSYFGLGDNIYHIPFVHKLAEQGEVFIYTPFPELFQFKNVYCFKPSTNLKLQLQNMQGNSLYSKSSGHHPNGERIRFNYGEGFRSGLTILQSFEKIVPLDGSFFFEFTPKPKPKVEEILKRVKASGKKLCVIRLPSVRQEWPNPNRNGRMEYFQLCINALKDKYYFVSVGDIGNKEDFDGHEPQGINERRDRHNVNHLGIWDVMDLVNRSDLVVSIQCNIIPICQLLRKKAFIIYGGYVPHSMLNDPRLFQLGYVEPEPFCFCVNRVREHICSKEIPEDKILSKLDELICN